MKLRAFHAKSGLFRTFTLIPGNTGIDSGIDAQIPNSGIENKSVFWKL